MRPIKFRAYDAKNKRMWVGITDLHFRNGEMIHARGQGEYYGRVQPIGSHADYNPTHKTDIIVMQFTGLKDKSGKEIYEGDIVRLEGWWNAAGPAGYDKPEVCVEWSAEHCGFDPFANYDTDCAVIHYASDCEVLGNIYENPELVDAQIDVD